MRHFHSITIGVILEQLRFYLPWLTRSTLNRREVDLGFSKPGRTRTQWRLFTPEKAQAFKIAVLEHYEKPLPSELEEWLANPEVQKHLDRARKEALRRQEVQDKNRLQSVTS